MKKLLIPLSCLLVSTAAPMITSHSNQDMQNFMVPKDWKMTPTTVSETKGPNESFKFIVTTINLTSLNIKSDIDFRYFYREVKIPDLIVTCDGNKILDSDTWNIKSLSLGKDDEWSRMFTKTEGQITMTLDRAYWMYYSVANRDLMLRLSYRAAMINNDSAGVKGGTISFARGSVIHIV